jgi:hypothetical protein
MPRDRLSSTFRQLGINERNCRALKLLPLVYVAWAEGEPSELRRQALLELGQRHFQIGEGAVPLLRWWMYRRPTAEYFAAGLQALFSLAHAPDDWEFDVAELPRLLSCAEAVARMTEQAPGSPTAVTEAEEWALAYLARVLHVENGKSWAALLRELDEPARAAPSSLSPRAAA